MITAIRSLSNVNGAVIWLFYWIICAAVYLIVCLAKIGNHRKGRVSTIFLGLLFAEIFIDIVWSLLYYPHGTYIEHGLRAVFGLLLWIPVLIATACAVSAICKRTPN